jgi:hypothetical protein
MWPRKIFAREGITKSFDIRENAIIELDIR